MGTSTAILDAPYPMPPPTRDITPPQTPTSTTTAAHELLAEIQSIHTNLQTLSNLAPGPVINALLTCLVRLCTQPYSTSFSTAFLSLPGIPELSNSLRTLCAEAEGELEHYWAHRILDALLTRTTPPDSDHEDADTDEDDKDSSARRALGLFPYHQNYIDLSRLECSMLDAFLPPCSLRSANNQSSNTLSVAFIGSGPMPLTSFCILDTYPGAAVHNFDRISSALAVSEELSEKLGYGERMTFSCCDVGIEGPEPEWTSFDVVFLAALVGMDTDSKRSILRLLAGKLKPGALVVARSARGVRSLIYPVLEISDELQNSGFEVLAEVHPWTEVVNSVVVLSVLGH